MSKFEDCIAEIMKNIREDRDSATEMLNEDMQKEEDLEFSEEELEEMHSEWKEED